MNAKQTRKAIMDLAALLAVACLVVLVFQELRGRPEGTRALEVPEPVQDWSALLDGGHHWGNAAAPVTMVTFVDFECPACRRFALDIEQDIRARYSLRDLRVVIRHKPLSYHRLAFHAAKASECAAEQGRFEEMYQLLFQKQDSLGLKSFGGFAAESGVPDIVAFERCTTSNRVDARILADIQAAERAGAKGTPTIILNGLRLPRIPREEELERMIENARIGRVIPNEKPL